MTRQLATFRLAGRLYGVDVLAVKEVSTEITHTPIPHAPSAVVGYVDLRSQLFLMLDVRQMLGMTPAAIGHDSRFVIFKPAVGESFRALVDSLGDIVSLESEQLEDWTGNEQTVAGDRLIEGVGKLEHELVIVLRPTMFLSIVKATMAG